ncbi:dock homology region 2 domain-containing protein [Ditylenchus destructor]|nr:dock homology region 2 domain-containing protein [Ditylenchus destructor]
MRLRGHLSGTVRGTAKGTVRRKRLAVPEVMRGGRNALQKASHMANNRRNLFSIGWDLEDDPMNARDDRHTTARKPSETRKTRHASREAPGYVSRCHWFDSLARAYFSERCFSEAAICQAHSVVIVGKELENRGLICLDWSLFNALNNQIVEDETKWENKSNVPIKGNEYSVENFTTRVQELIHTIVLDEHYEAVGLIYRLVIPIYEQHRKYSALLQTYAELHQATRRASEVCKSNKRHTGSYFLVVFLGKTHFG